MATKQLKREDVNPALLQRAADELDIGVPIHAWELEGGKLRLHLAYGQEAVWAPGGDAEDASSVASPVAGPEPDGLQLGIDYEWTKDDGPELVGLDELKKQVLVRLALDHGLKILRKKNFLKADYLAVLERRREALQ